MKTFLASKVLSLRKIISFSKDKFSNPIIFTLKYILFQTLKMHTFLVNHFKIQQLEARLNKNEYLSNECLPNFIDAKVFKALKTSNQIPKRQSYPNLYHWYVLMRQFADRTLEHWLKNDQAKHFTDQIINQVVEIILNPTNLLKTEKSKHFLFKKCVSQKNLETESCDFNNCLKQKQKLDEMTKLRKKTILLSKRDINLIKDPQNRSESVTQYFMSIKVTEDVKDCVKRIKLIFEDQRIQFSSFQIISESIPHSRAYEFRVYFSTTAQHCENLKTKILKCSSVETIQCKKLKFHH